MSLTVKWIMSFSGIDRERLFQADNVEAFFPATIDGKMPMCGDSNQPVPALPFKHHDYDLHRNSVFVDAGPGGAGFQLTEGRVYVMNAEGRTVASYDLGYIQNQGPSSQQR